MKKNMTLLLSLFTILFAISATAEGNFIPVPTSEEAPLRLFVGLDGNGGFSPYLLKHIQGGGSVVYGVGSGFDVGFTLHGGVSNGAHASTQGLFVDGNMGTGIVGADFMLRFLGNVTEMFFMGIQATVGYKYDWSGANFAEASSVPVTAGIAFGLSFTDVVQIYLFPQFNFGGRGADDSTKIWGSQVGMSAAVGAWINMGGTKLVIQARPGWETIFNLGNFDSQNFCLDGLIGLAWDM